MNKVDLTDYANDILKSINKGHTAIISSNPDGSGINTMTVSWGHIGQLFRNPVCTIYVRQTRHTHELIKKTGYFSLGLSIDKSNREVGDIFLLSGKQSGKDIDKVKELGFTASDSQVSPVPLLDKFDLILECKVLYSVDFTPKDMDQKVIDIHYSHGLETDNFHTAFFGALLNIYDNR